MDRYIHLDEYYREQQKEYVREEMKSLREDNFVLRKENNDFKDNIILYRVVLIVFILISMFLM